VIAVRTGLAAGSTGWFLDLFAGAGGFSLGLSAAGFRCFGVVERDARCAETHAKNFPDHAQAPLSRLGPDLGDITRLSEQEVRRVVEASGSPEIDIVAGGPPCQGFSRVGRGKLDSLARRRGAFRNDPRNQLYRRYLDLLAWTRPRGFIFENVPGILRVRGENFAEQVCLDAEDLGYVVRCAVLNSAWYGVPQTRERVIILGFREDLDLVPEFPEPRYSVPERRGARASTGLRTAPFRHPRHFVEIEPRAGLPRAVTVHEAIRDLPPVPARGPDASKFAARILPIPVKYRPGRPTKFSSRMRNWCSTVPAMWVRDHACRHNPRDYRIFARMRPNDCYPRAVEIAEELFADAKARSGHHVERSEFVPPYSLFGFEEKWKMLDPESPSWTVTAHLSKDCYSHIHYDGGQARTITIREAARLQSFPDHFQFCGGMGDQFRQIGNAIPPLLALAIAQRMKSSLARAASTTAPSSWGSARIRRGVVSSARSRTEWRLAVGNYRVR